MAETVLSSRPAGLWVIPVAALSVCLAIEFGLSGLDSPARRALQIFAVAIVLWTLTTLEDAYVALAAAVAMTLLVTGSPNDLFSALGDNLVWLLVAAFVFAEAFRKTGLAERLVSRVTAGARTMRRLYYSLTGVMLASAFIVPSTSGRAAIMLPVFASIATTMPNARMRAAFALLFPTGILLGAFGSLVGAGAHITAVELLTTTTGQTVSFASWTLLGLPLAAASSFVAAEAILRLFLTAEERDAPIVPIAPAPSAKPLLQHPVLWVAAAVLTGWLTAPWHGINETIVAILGALIITAPGIGPLRFKEALKSVDWGLLVFLAATISLAQALVSSNAAGQLLEGPLASLRETKPSAVLIAAVLAALGIALHFVVHSRTARVAVLLPPILLLAAELSINPAAAMLVTVAATGFCQTLIVSAKPVIMFAGVGGATYTQRDLLRLSSVIAPIHFAIVMVFAVAIWPWLGVSLTR